MPPKSLKDAKIGTDPDETLAEALRLIQAELVEVRTANQARIDELQAENQRRHNESQQRMDAMAQLIAELQVQNKQNSMSPTASLSDHSETKILQGQPTHPNTPKIHLTNFDGANPLDWLFKAEHYFELYQVPEYKRLSVASFYMQGDALGWFKWMQDNDQFTTWEAFVRDVELRFGHSTYENHQAPLFKLQQDKTVAEYEEKSETLCNRVTDLPHILNEDMAPPHLEGTDTGSSSSTSSSKCTEVKPKIPEDYVLI